MSKWTATQPQPNVVQDSKDHLRAILVTNYTYGSKLTDCAYESSIAEHVDDRGKVELESCLVASKF